MIIIIILTSTRVVKAKIKINNVNFIAASEWKEK